MSDASKRIFIFPKKFFPNFKKIFNVTVSLFNNKYYKRKSLLHRRRSVNDWKPRDIANPRFFTQLAFLVDYLLTLCKFKAYVAKIAILKKFGKP